MGYNLRQFETEGKFHRALTFDTPERAVPLATIKAVLQAEGVRVPRERKRNMVVIVLVTRAMSLYPPLSLKHVMQKLAQGQRFVWGGGPLFFRAVPVQPSPQRGRGAAVAAMAPRSRRPAILRLWAAIALHATPEGFRPHAHDQVVRFGGEERHGLQAPLMPAADDVS